LLEGYPLKPHEILRDRSDRVFKHLVSLAAEHPGEPVWLLQQDGTVQPLKLGKLASKENKDQINSQTVILPPKVNGLKAGLLTGDPKDVADDVADEWLDEKPKGSCLGGPYRRRHAERAVDRGKTASHGGRKASGCHCGKAPRSGQETHRLAARNRQPRSKELARQVRRGDEARRVDRVPP